MRMLQCVFLLFYLLEGRRLQSVFLLRSMAHLYSQMAWSPCFVSVVSYGFAAGYAIAHQLVRNQQPQTASSPAVDFVDEVVMPFFREKTGALASHASSAMQTVCDNDAMLCSTPLSCIMMSPKPRLYSSYCDLARPPLFYSGECY